MISLLRKNLVPGGFGSVYLVNRRGNSEYYAIKVMDKSRFTSVGKKSDK
jgi:hypothetical protein